MDPPLRRAPPPVAPITASCPRVQCWASSVDRAPRAPLRRGDAVSRPTASLDAAAPSLGRPRVDVIRETRARGDGFGHADGAAIGAAVTVILRLRWPPSWFP